MSYADELWLKRLREIDADRLMNYRTRWEYYTGKQKQPLPVRTGQPDDNVIMNFARLIVDKGVAFLFGKEIDWQLEEGSETPAEAKLAEIWQANRKMTFLGKAGTSGGVYGDVFVKTVPDGIRKGIPRLINLEPENVSVIWDDEDIEQERLFRIEWTSRGVGDKPVHKRQDVFLDDRERWQVENRVSLGEDKYQPDPDNPDFAWKYDWPPIIHAQNMPLPGSYYGLADIEETVMQDAINYVASKMQRVTRYDAHPKTIGKGFKPDAVRMLEDEILVLPSADSDLFNLEMRSDLSGTRAFLELLISWHLGTARIPRLDPAQVTVGAMSGFALRILCGDLIEKNATKQRTYGDMLIELNRRLLEMAGMGAENVCEIHWPDPLPEDDKANTELAKFMLDYKLASIETIRGQFGLDNDDETARLEAEEAASGNIGAALVRQFERGQTVPQAPQQPVPGQPALPAPQPVTEQPA